MLPEKIKQTKNQIDRELFLQFIEHHKVFFNAHKISLEEVTGCFKDSKTNMLYFVWKHKYSFLKKKFKKHKETILVDEMQSLVETPLHKISTELTTNKIAVLEEEPINEVQVLKEYINKLQTEIKHSTITFNEVEAKYNTNVMYWKDQAVYWKKIAHKTARLLIGITVIIIIIAILLSVYIKYLI